MALADPQSVTVGGSAASLPRTSTGPNSSTYTKADSTVSLQVSSAYGRRYQRRARITSTKITTDPLHTTSNVRVSMSASVLLDVPPTGFSQAEQKEILLAIATWLSASTGANADKLVGGEN